MLPFIKTVGEEKDSTQTVNNENFRYPCVLYNHEMQRNALEKRKWILVILQLRLGL